MPFPIEKYYKDVTKTVMNYIIQRVSVYKDEIEELMKNATFMNTSYTLTSSMGTTYTTELQNFKIYYDLLEHGLRFTVNESGKLALDSTLDQYKKLKGLIENKYPLPPNCRRMLQLVNAINAYKQDADGVVMQLKTNRDIYWKTLSEKRAGGVSSRPVGYEQHYFKIFHDQLLAQGE